MLSSLAKLATPLLLALDPERAHELTLRSAQTRYATTVRITPNNTPTLTADSTTISAVLTWLGLPLPVANSSSRARPAPARCWQAAGRPHQWPDT
jgi:hypothetical protein